MQIHEITQHKLIEGILDKAKTFGNKAMAVANYAAGDYGKSAEYSQKVIQSQGRDTASEVDPKNSWENKYKNLTNTPGMADRITGLAQEWIKSPEATTTPAPTPTTSALSPTTATTNKISEPVFIGGKQLDPKNPNDAKVLAAIEKQNIKEAPEYTTTGGIAIPAGVKTDKAPVLPITLTATDYAEKFQQWSDKKLATKIQGLYGQSATMDEVRKITGLDAKLNVALQQVTKTQNTPQHEKAIQEYLKLAAAGIQAIGQQKRYQATQAKYSTDKESMATNQLGITDRQLQGLKTLAQTPDGKAQLIKDLGIV